MVRFRLNRSARPARDPERIRDIILTADESGGDQKQIAANRLLRPRNLDHLRFSNFT
jgi:hypothetical protein